MHVLIIIARAYGNITRTRIMHIWRACVSPDAESLDLGAVNLMLFNMGSNGPQPGAMSVYCDQLEIQYTHWTFSPRSFWFGLRLLQELCDELLSLHLRLPHVGQLLQEGRPNLRNLGACRKHVLLDSAHFPVDCLHF